MINLVVLHNDFLLECGKLVSQVFVLLNLDVERCHNLSPLVYPLFYCGLLNLTLDDLLLVFKCGDVLWDDLFEEFRKVRIGKYEFFQAKTSRIQGLSWMPCIALDRCRIRPIVLRETRVTCRSALSFLSSKLLPDWRCRVLMLYLCLLVKDVDFTSAFICF